MCIISHCSHLYAPTATVVMVIHLHLNTLLGNSQQLHRKESLMYMYIHHLHVIIIFVFTARLENIWRFLVYIIKKKVVKFLSYIKFLVYIFLFLFLFWTGSPMQCVLTVADEHCVQLVSEGIVDKLITLLQQQNKKDSNITLQHAVLSALRNLAIPCKWIPRVLCVCSGFFFQVHFCMMDEIFVYSIGVLCLT